MSVLGRLLVSSAERLDLPDLLSIDSYGAGDWKYFLQGLVGTTTPYILTGFDVINPQLAIGTTSCSIQVANSVVFYPGSLAGPFFVGLPSGPTSLPLVPQLRQNATNYIYLTFTTFATSEDSRAFWDPDINGGVGGEFSQNVNTESVLGVQVNVSVNAFPSNVIPVAAVTVNATVITAIEDCRDLMFRLGTGGIAPDPYNTFNWPALPSSQYEREEPPTTVTAGGVNPFEGADKNINTLKQWMDAIMSKLKELGGTTYWYEDTSTFNLISLFTDAIETSVTTKGTFTHSSVTPGVLSWSEDVNYEITGDPRNYVLRAGNVTIPNGDVAYLALNRNGKFNNSNQPVSWSNGATYVNSIGAVIGSFSNLAQGDWVKRPTDPDSYYLQVVGLYNAPNGGGTPTTAANAVSIVLNGTYQGPTVNDIGTYDQGIYNTSDSPADVIVSARNNPAINTLGGDFSWFAFRDDTVEGIASVATTTLTISNITCTEDTALVTTTAAHGLSNDYYVTITGTTNYNGTFAVEVESSTTFSITVASTLPPEVSGTAYWTTIGTAATYIPGSNPPIQLESADHGFANSETIIINGTGTALDGNSYKVGVVDATHFQLGPPSAVTSSTGTATLARVFVRNQGGTLQLVQGVSVNPDGPYDNIKLFIGMAADSQIHPEYATTIANTLEGQENFNTLATENVTSRLSNLTAMMADRAQDKTIKYLPVDIKTVGNQTSGGNQLVTFTSSSTPYLTILQPGSPGNAVIDLSGTITLPTNYSAYIVINRNAGTTPSIVTAASSAVPVDENIFVIASRLTETNIYLWDGSEWQVGDTPFANSGSGLQKVRLNDPVDVTLPVGTPVTIDGVVVNADDLVLFSNLSSGNNEIYKAIGTGTTITSWQSQLLFSGLATPTSGDTVIATAGDGFADTIGTFTGTTWSFNNKVRYFNGVDYWEQSSLNTVALADNQVSPADIFSIAWLGSQNIIVDYSILRGTTKETGTITLTTDGTTVGIATANVDLEPSAGVTFSGMISGSNIHLQYTSTSTGSAGTMKFSMKRWSDGAGGPGNIPSYSIGAGAGVSSLNGLSGAVVLAAGSNITLTPSGNTITIASTGGGGFSVLGPFTITDNTVSPTPVFTYAASTNNFATIEYSILRNGAYRVGRLIIANDGSITSSSDDNVETSPTGVTLTADVSGGNVRVLYTSTSTGFNGALKYTIRSWS